ncbi:CDP-alcohol phosphatidyltransferase family protein [Anaeromicropila herbilytica]|uniref:Phosphatidylglycerophosphate synthase n=1 Tax=Anaeromicropila herbilytica TaxID=2785025 RepID=A0A7R7ELG7_9FIRM|nr:CDP-alcohol phosphatidyltransferase family protein [Anaeromicropila herbilytica]BCN30984.1 CDP-alcohol phosphatidyltransferase [Anaeromicropila herbilytica]
MKTIKNIPNYLSVSRILASVSLLLEKPFSAVFFSLYLICGISDVLDGYLARKMNVTSKLGQLLDSVSDFIFISIVLYIYIPSMAFPLWIIGLIVIIVVIRVASLILGFVRHHQLTFLHTYANKATGLVLFFFPILFSIVGKEITATLICCIASISAMEDMLINMTSKTLNRDIKSNVSN